LLCQILSQKEGFLSGPLLTLTALKALIVNNFGEDDSVVKMRIVTPQEVTPATEGELLGIAASPGIAIAPVVHYGSVPIYITQYNVENVEIEWHKLQPSIQIAKQEVQALLSHAYLHSSGYRFNSLRYC
jgi:phosphocarrier protein FPr